MNIHSPKRVFKRVSYKADVDTTDGEGSFTAIVSTFGTKDSQGQIIEKGAFEESLKTFTDDSPLPVLWDHEWEDIWSHLGAAQGQETDTGLQIDAQLDMDNPNAVQAYRLMKTGRVHEFSIGGFVNENDIEYDDDNNAHISRFQLAEVSLTLKGANPDTQLISIKADEPDPQDTADPQTDPEEGDDDMDLTDLKDTLDLLNQAVDKLSQFIDENDTSDDDGTSTDTPGGNAGDEGTSDDSEGKSAKKKRQALAAQLIKALVAGKETI